MRSGTTRADVWIWGGLWGLAWALAVLLGRSEAAVLYGLGGAMVLSALAPRSPGPRALGLAFPVLALGVLATQYALQPAEASAPFSIGVLCAVQLGALVWVQAVLLPARSGVLVGRFLLASLAATSTFLVGELGAERVWPRAAHGIQVAEGSLAPEPYLPDPELQHVPAPGFRGTFVHPEYWNEVLATNAEGYRGAEWPTAAPAVGELRVLLLGDSTTVGFGVSEDETIAARLEELLRERTGGEVRVLNGGVAGYSPCHAKIVLARLLARARPTHVLCLAYDGNDLEDCRARFVHAREAGVHDERLSTERAVAPPDRLAGSLFGRTYWYRYSALYRRLEVSLAPFVARSGLVEPDHAYVSMLRVTRTEPSADVAEELDLATDAVRGMHRQCSAVSTPFGLVRLPARVQTETGSFDDLVRRFGASSADHDRRLPGRTLLDRARAAGISTLDLLPVLEVEGHGPNPSYFLEGHPNREGNRAIASAIAGMFVDEGW